MGLGVAKKLVKKKYPKRKDDIYWELHSLREQERKPRQTLKSTSLITSQLQPFSLEKELEETKEGKEPPT